MLHLLEQVQKLIAARDSGAVVIASADGVVDYVDSKKIIVKTMGGKDTYYLKQV